MTSTPFVNLNLEAPAAVPDFGRTVTVMVSLTSAHGFGGGLGLNVQLGLCQGESSFPPVRSGSSRSERRSGMPDDVVEARTLLDELLGQLTQEAGTLDLTREVLVGAGPGRLEFCGREPRPQSL